MTTCAVRTSLTVSAPRTSSIEITPLWPASVRVCWTSRLTLWSPASDPAPRWLEHAAPGGGQVATRVPRAFEPRPKPQPGTERCVDRDDFPTTIHSHEQPATAPPPVRPAASHLPGLLHDRRPGGARVPDRSLIA